MDERKYNVEKSILVWTCFWIICAVVIPVSVLIVSTTIGFVSEIIFFALQETKQKTNTMNTKYLLISFVF
jgi:hypothetical protein